MTTTMTERGRLRGSEPWKRPVRLTALYHEHARLGAVFAEQDGWLLPRSYADTASELRAVRSSVGLLDISEGGKLNLKGDDLDSVLAGTFPGSSAGATGSYTPMGAFAGWVARLAGDEALIFTSPSELEQARATIEVALSGKTCTHLTDVTSCLAGLRLLGPFAIRVLERVSAVDLAPDRFADHTVAQGPVAGAHALIVRRDGAGLTGYDLYVDRDLAAYVWDSLLDLGAPVGLRPIGRDSEEGLS